MKYVSGFNTPFAPLGLAMGWINVGYIPFASLRLWIITYQHPTNAKRAFGVDLAECHTRIHNVDFGAEGV